MTNRPVRTGAPSNSRVSGAATPFPSFPRPDQPREKADLIARGRPLIPVDQKDI
jgi:hypothetical protein